MSDIEMRTDDTLELDAIIEEWSDPQSVIQKHNVDSNNYNLSGFKTHTGVFDPQESGTYEFNINGQILSIEVKEASAIPDSVIELFNSTFNSTYGDYSEKTDHILLNPPPTQTYGNGPTDNKVTVGAITKDEIDFSSYQNVVINLNYYNADLGSSNKGDTHVTIFIGGNQEKIVFDDTKNDQIDANINIDVSDISQSGKLEVRSVRGGTGGNDGHDTEVELYEVEFT